MCVSEVATLSFIINVIIVGWHKKKGPSIFKMLELTHGLSFYGMVVWRGFFLLLLFWFRRGFPIFQRFEHSLAYAAILFYFVSS